MELKDLRFFCLTAETQHVTRSADKLGISQSSLTRIIGNIEEEIGGELFEKVGRSIRLTKNGELFYRHAKRVLDDVETLTTEMDYEFERRARTLTLLCNTEVFAGWMATELKKSHPKYALSILHASKAEMQEALLRGDADFAVCCPQIPDNYGDIITTERVFYQKPMVLFPPGHRLLKKENVGLDDLKYEPLITMQKESAMRNMLDPVFEESGFRPHIVCETNDINTIIKLAAGGVGYAFVTRLIMADHQELLEYCIDADFMNIKADFGMSYRRGALDDKNHRHFKDYFTNALRRLSQELYPEDFTE